MCEFGKAGLVRVWIWEGGASACVDFGKAELVRVWI